MFPHFGWINKKTMILRLILGDQLNHQHTWFDEVADETLYVMMEMRQETDYVQHHIQKIIAFFTAMRAFASEKQALGHRFVYIRLDDEANTQSLTENLSQLIATHTIRKFEYQLPDELRLDVQLREFCESLEFPSQVYDTEHFFTKRNELADFFVGKKMMLLENFYRAMRKKHNLLMDGDEPLTGQWNYDAENRKKLPKDHKPVEPLAFNKDVSDVVQLLAREKVDFIGRVDAENFIWPTTRNECLTLLDFFLDNCLQHFGTYEDSMATEYWSIYHSRLSFAMNIKLLSPHEVIGGAIKKWEDNQTQISIAQIEGFVRQIVGWREFMRGIYWMKMPDFASMNFFGNARQLPSWFWTGKTKMSCLKHSIGQSLDYAYAHHIQRLMITGNFAALAGIDPDSVDAWYLGIYIDAIEWVEITNTRGMSQFADGGIIGTKPYVASANYVNKMGDYCTGCYYDKNEKLGDSACPFNSLYWHFHARNRDKLEKNPRIGMVYRVLDKMDTEQLTEVLNQADRNLARIEQL